jgi:hypothetical protein
VVLQDVAGCAGIVVEARAPADADVFGHRDLHRVDEVRVPDRLEQRVREPQREQVLHRLLAEVVVDPEHVFGGEDRVDQRVEFARGFEVVPERLLDDDPPPAAAFGVVGHLRARHLVEHDREGGRRDRQVERGVALDAVGVLELDQLGRERVECVVVVERAGQEAQRVGDPPPDVLAELGT